MGTCNDESCGYQHTRDYLLSEQQIGDELLAVLQAQRTAPHAAKTARPASVSCDSSTLVLILVLLCVVITVLLCKAFMVSLCVWL